MDTLIRSTLRMHAEAAAVGVDLAPERVEAKVQLRRTRRARRPALVMLGIAAVLAVPIAFAVAAALPTSEPVSGMATILVRHVPTAAGAAVDVVAVLPDGRERPLMQVPPTILPAGWELGSGSVSDTGWVALSFSRPDGSEGFVLTSIADPERPSRLVEHPDLGVGAYSYGWAPDGRFGTSVNNGTVLIVDPLTGDSQAVRLDGDLPFAGLEWTADGAGLLTVAGESSWFIYDNETTTPMREAVQVLHLDGSPPSPGVPALHPRPWARRHAPGGARSQVCRSFDGVGCPGLPDGAVVVQDGDGGVTTAYRDELAPARVTDASFAVDGSSLWLLLDGRPDGRGFMLARAGGAEGDAIRLVAAANPRADAGRPWLAGLAPDDSVMAVGANEVTTTMLLPTDGGTPSLHDGYVAGFVPAEVVAGWPGGAWASVPDTAPPSSVALPTAPPMGLLAAQADGPVLLPLAQDGDPSAAGTETTRGGLVTLDEGIGFIAACVGPGVMSIVVGDPTFSPITVDCLAGEIHHEAGPGVVIDHPVTVTVTADATTSWRLIIYDPPHRERRLR